MSERTVLVWDSPHKIRLYQMSNSVWIAVGEYLGERIEVKRQTERAALSGWVEEARHKRYL